MKKLILLPFILLAIVSKAQWTGAVFDSLTHNTDRDEVNHQCIDIDASDNMYVVYKRATSGSGWNIFMRGKNSLGVWSPEDSLPVTSAYDPVLGVSYYSGNVYVAYTTDDGGDQDIFISTKSGLNWNTQQVTSDSSDENAPTIDVDTAGHVHLAWIGIDSAGDYKIYYSTNLSGTWETKVIANSQLGMFGSGASPEIAVQQNGVAHIVYRGDQGTGYHVFHAYNGFPGDTTWTIDVLVTNNLEDLSAAICIDRSDNVHVLASGDDGFGFPVKAFYFFKDPVSVAFNAAVDVAPSFSATVGDIFADSYNVPHCVLNEVSGNLLTGNIIYADSTDWNGSTLINTNDTYEGHMVMNSDGHAYLAVYRGNTFPDEEVVVYGYSPTVNVTEPVRQDLLQVFTSQNSISIRFKENYSGTVVCFDAMGKVVRKLSGNFTSNDIKQITNLPTGVYFISMPEKKIVIRVAVE